MPDFQLQFRVDPLVINTTNEHCCGHWSAMDLFALAQEAAAETHNMSPDGGGKQAS